MNGFGYLVPPGCMSTCKKDKALNPNHKQATYHKTNIRQTVIAQLTEKEWEYAFFIAQFCIPSPYSKMVSSEFLSFFTASLWAQDIPCLCYIPP